MTSNLPDGVETVAVAVPDNVGRLMGKRVARATYERIRERGMPMPDYFLVTWLENAPQDGFPVTGWHTGWPNCRLVPDEDTLRVLPWAPEQAIVLCDARRRDGAPLPMASRAVLAAQLERAAARGLTPVCAAELEFWLFAEPFAAAHAKGYRDLVPSHHRVQDNDLLQARADEAFIGNARRLLPRLGVDVELSQGEGGEGQHEITLGHCEMAQMADRTVLYKHALKELAQDAGQALTFMAKPRSDGPGSSGHVHLSLRDRSGRTALPADGGLSDLGRRFLAGLVAYTPELMALHAPYVNSYRRLRPRSFAPTNASWGFDNRTACFRVVGQDEALRIECRMPGADANPYWSFAALLMAGLAGLERAPELPAETRGNAYEDGAAEPLPADLTEAIAAFRASEVARSSLGDEVHAHICGLLAAELDAGRAAVSDWERLRAFDVV